MLCRAFGSNRSSSGFFLETRNAIIPALLQNLSNADEEQAHMPDYRVRLLHDVLEVSPKDEFLKVYQESADNGPEASVRLSPETYEKAR